MRRLPAIETALPRVHLLLVAAWGLHHIARTNGLPQRLADHPLGSLLLQGVSLLVLLATVSACAWLVWGTLRLKRVSAWLCLAALGGALAVRNPQPDALDIAWVLVVVPLSVLALERRPEGHRAN